MCSARFGTVIQLTRNGRKEREIQLTFTVISPEALLVLSGHSELGSKLESVSV
jgi:hypothetical protein